MSSCTLCTRPLAKGEALTELTVYAPQTTITAVLCFACIERLYLGAVKVRCSEASNGSGG